jgi:hypothetical protein
MTKLPNGIFRNCTNLVTIKIPNAIKTIESNAFRGCTSLATITLPTALKEIGSSAFADCVNLMEVIADGVSPAKINSNSFAKSTSREGILKVRNSAKKNYDLDKQWCKFLNVNVY